MSTKTLITLDYELFFGEKTGTIERCLLEPTRRIVEVLDKHHAKLVLFVDASYLVRLKQLSGQYAKLREHYDTVAQQLQTLVQQGHDVQLHIHPHWNTSHYDGNQWQIDPSKYRLHDYNQDEIQQIVSDCCAVLSDITGRSPFAYRAGGWCLQPFDQIADALWDNGVWIDSTVFENGVSEDPTRWFNFTDAPKKGHWYFNASPEIENTSGRFLEIPISSHKLTPLFFWKMVFIKKLAKGAEHASFGDGNTMSANAGYYLTRLTTSTYSPVSIDGTKAGILEDALRVHQQRFPQDIFNIMGHPKSISEYSLTKLDRFFAKHRDIETVTFQNLVHMKPNN